MTIPPSKPDRSPEDSTLTVVGAVSTLVLLFAAFLVLVNFIIGVGSYIAPYRVQCNDPNLPDNDAKKNLRHGSWDVRSAEKFLREETGKGSRCQREYTER